MSDAKPAVPTPVTIALVLVGVALVIGAFLLGRSLGTAEEPTTTTSEIAPLAAPESLKAFQKGEESDPSTGPDKEIVRANYTDGTDKILLVLSRPEADLEKFLADAGINDLQQQADKPGGDEVSPTLCGKSADTGFAACGRINGGVGELIVGATEMQAATLVELLEELQR